MITMSNIFDKLIREDLIELAMLNNWRIFSKLPVKFKKLYQHAVVPTRATDGSAGWDLTVNSCESCGSIVSYKTGIAVEIPKGYFGLLVARSSC